MSNILEIVAALAELKSKANPQTVKLRDLYFLCGPPTADRPEGAPVLTTSSYWPEYPGGLNYLRENTAYAEAAYNFDFAALHAALHAALAATPAAPAPGGGAAASLPLGPLHMVELDLRGAALNAELEQTSYGAATILMAAVRKADAALAKYRVEMATTPAAAPAPVEAGESALQSALESATDTNRVLAHRLKAVADRVPGLIHLLELAESEADKDEPNDGYETLYNAATSVRGSLRALLREFNGEGGSHAA